MEKAKASEVRHFIIMDQDHLRLCDLIVSASSLRPKTDLWSVFALGLAGIICAFMREDEVSLVAEVSSGG